MLYISITALLENAPKDSFNAAEMLDTLRALSLEEGTEPAVILDRLLNEHLVELVKNNIREGVNISASVLLDENGDIVYRDVVTLVTGVAKDAQGNHVYFTGVGPLTVIT